MKCALFILLILLVLSVLAYYAYNKYLIAPEISAELDLSKILIEKKIIYNLDYSGVGIDGVYLIGKSQVQNQDHGEYQVSTIKKGGIFGIQLYKKRKLLGELKVDLNTYKITLKTNNR